MACSCFLCFRENVVATCKIGSFLCSLYNLLQKNVIFFFGNQISKWRLFFSSVQFFYLKKRTIFDLRFIFLVTREKLQKFLQHISHPLTYTYFAHPSGILYLTNFEKIRIYQVWFLVLILIRAILEQSINNKMVFEAKFKLECLLLIMRLH